MLKKLILIAGAVSFSWVSGATEFKAQTIDDKIGIGYGLAIGDVNGDAKPDVLLVDKEAVVWYENPGWEKHALVEKLTKLDNVCIAAQDIDDDGKCEVAVGAGWNPGDTLNSGAVFYLIPPQDRMKLWKPVELHHEPTVHRMWWVHDDAGKYSLLVAPLHGKGNKGGAGEGVHLLEYVVPENHEGEWQTRLVDDSMHMTHNLDPVQWDSDRADEVLFCGKEGVLLLDRSGDEWTRKKVIGEEGGNGFNGAGEVRLGRMKEGRFIATVEPMHGNTLVVYSEPSSGGKGLWTRHAVDSTFAEGHALATADFSKSGTDQIAIGWRNKNSEGKVGIRIYELKDPKALEWSHTTVDDNEMACEDMKAADLNGDGWVDLVAAGRATKNVKIYWNQGRK